MTTELDGLAERMRGFAEVRELPVAVEVPDAAAPSASSGSSAGTAVPRSTDPPSGSMTR